MHVLSRNAGSQGILFKITAVLEFFTVEFNCVGNHFLEEFFPEIS